MTSPRCRPRRCGACFLLSFLLGAACPAAEEWELVLRQEFGSAFSGDRHNALKQVDTNTVKGLRALWKILALADPDRVDWYVREGAYEALLRAGGEEPEAEILKTLKSKSKKDDLAKEAIVYSVVWKLRKQFVKDFGGSDDDKIAEAKYRLRKTRGLDYFELILPVVKKVDPDGKRLEWIRLAYADNSTRVRRAAIQGFLAYPHESSIPLLLDNLAQLSKSKRTKSINFREYVLTRYALETLTGMYFRDSVEDWRRWWEANKDSFSIEKRVEEEKDEDDEEGKGKTRVVRRGGVEVRVKMKVAGDPDNYPLLVLPWGRFEPDYFRPYFHGVEGFLRVFYLEMPSVDDFKGLQRDAKSNLVKYPTELLASALGDLMLGPDVGLEKFAVLGHGPAAGTLGMMMAAQYPSQISHLVLINPMSSGRVYGDAIANVEREGRRRKNKEISNGAKNLQIRDGKPLYQPGDSEEAAGMGRALFNLRFADGTEPEVGALRFFYSVPSTTQVLNDQSWSLQTIFERKKSSVPLLLAMGEKDPWTPVADMRRIGDAFLRSMEVRFSLSSELPFVSECYKFTATLEKFFKKAVTAHKKQKDKSRVKP